MNFYTEFHKFTLYNILVNQQLTLQKKQKFSNSASFTGVFHICKILRVYSKHSTETKFETKKTPIC